jgi:carbon monoxide dehydrogenase subunit G
VEISFERDARVAAPVELVWAEMNSLENVLTKSPQLLTYSVQAENRASVRTKLTWGPLKYEVDGTMAVQQTVPNQLLEYTVAIPELGLNYAAAMRTTPAGGSETTLHYVAYLELNHRLAAKLRGLFSELIEEHIHGLVGRVKTRAEQRRLADERLLK